LTTGVGNGAVRFRTTPLAGAIVEGGASPGVAPHGVEAVNAIPGHGTEARVKGCQVVVGKLKLMRDRKIATGELGAHARRLAMTGLEPDGARSIAKTDAVLGVRKGELVPGMGR